LISITAIIGPVMMTGLFAFFADPAAQIYFPGAAFLTAAILGLLSLFAAIKALGNSLPSKNN
jgi:DHA1 family tetracycline resistance protein-like MFS transporter